MDLGLKGKVALVSGASKGMGRAIAEEFARNGVAVAMTARGRPALEEAVEGIRAAGGKAIGVQGDMTVKADVMRAVDATRQAFGPPDIAIHNTNNTLPETNRGFDNTTDDAFRACHDDYVMSVVHLAREVLPHMKAQRWGRIVSLTSVCVKAPHVDPLVLNNMRVVTVALLKTLSNEAAPFNVTINNIAPGPIITPSFEDYVKQLGQDLDTASKWAANTIPAGRCGTPQDIADMTVFLASERASFVTGQTILVDGGYTHTLY